VSRWMLLCPSSWYYATSYVGTAEVVGEDAAAGAAAAGVVVEDVEDVDELHESGAESSTFRVNSDMSASRCVLMNGCSIS